MILKHKVKYLLYRGYKTWVSMIWSDYRTKDDYKVEEQRWFLLKSTTNTKMGQTCKMYVIFWIRQLTGKQDFSRVNNRKEVKLDKDAWNASMFRKMKKKMISKKKWSVL